MDVFELTPDPKPKGWRRGAGTVGYSDSGELFINSLLIGMDAMTAFLCCSYDGTATMCCGKKVLVPLEWAVREKPHLEAELRSFESLAAASREAQHG